MTQETQLPKFKFSDLWTADKLKQVVTVQEKGIAAYPWTQVDAVPVEQDEQSQINHIIKRIHNYRTNLMNEATIWSRAIYPLLVLAEQKHIQAWSEVSIEVPTPKAILYGTIDGVLGNSIAGTIEPPYLVIAEAKRGLEGRDPRYQLYAQMVATAYFNADDLSEPQSIYGCYTIGASWSFVRGIVHDQGNEKPKMEIESSRDYVEKYEAEQILRILKLIVGQYLSTV